MKPNATHQRWANVDWQRAWMPARNGCQMPATSPSSSLRFRAHERIILSRRDWYLIRLKVWAISWGFICIQWELFIIIHSMIHSNIYWVPSICKAVCQVMWEIQPHLQGVHIRRGINNPQNITLIQVEKWQGPEWRKKQYRLGVQRRELSLTFNTVAAWEGKVNYD